MRVPNALHIARPWRIHELAHDFRLEDVWELPTPGGPDDFPRLVELVARRDPAEGGGSLPARALWALRWKLGALLGWDGEDTGLGARVPSLRERLPDDLRDTAPDEPMAAGLFTPLYALEHEAAAEIANKTVHGIAHLGWVRDADGDGWHGEMAVYVKPNGRLGDLYLAAIRPFRYTLVYPPALRKLGRDWELMRPRAEALIMS